MLIYRCKNNVNIIGKLPFYLALNISVTLYLSLWRIFTFGTSERHVAWLFLAVLCTFPSIMHFILHIIDRSTPSNCLFSGPKRKNTSVAMLYEARILISATNQILGTDLISTTNQRSCCTLCNSSPMLKLLYAVNCL